jgi:hypothetical protein
VAARVRQLVTVGWRQQLCGRIERSAAPDAGAQRDIVAGDLCPTINVSGLLAMSLNLSLFVGDPSGQNT